MSRTIRKDKEGNKFPDGRASYPEINYRCRCSWCTGIDKQALECKIAKRELKQELKDIGV